MKEAFEILVFDDGWVFPHGSNHLASVEVVAQIRPSHFDKSVVATLGADVEIVRDLSSFAYEHTPSNSYRFVWRDCP